MFVKTKRRGRMLIKLMEVRVMANKGLEGRSLASRNFKLNHQNYLQSTNLKSGIGKGMDLTQ
jgi:hypothetical protein